MMKYFIVSYRANSGSESITGSITLKSEAVFFNKNYFTSYMQDTFKLRNVVIIFIMRLTQKEYEAYTAE